MAKNALKPRISKRVKRCHFPAVFACATVAQFGFNSNGAPACPFPRPPVLLEKMLACIRHLLYKYRKTACHLWLYPLSSHPSDRVAWFQSDSWWNLFLIHANPVFIMEKLPALSGSERSYQTLLPRVGPCDLCSNSPKMSHYLPGKRGQQGQDRMDRMGSSSGGTGLHLCPLWGHGGTGDVTPTPACELWEQQGWDGAGGIPKKFSTKLGSCWGRSFKTGVNIPWHQNLLPTSHQGWAAPQEQLLGAPTPGGQLARALGCFVAPQLLIYH